VGSQSKRSKQLQTKLVQAQREKVWDWTRKLQEAGFEVSEPTCGTDTTDTFFAVIEGLGPCWVTVEIADDTSLLSRREGTKFIGDLE
jgi:hypothetical protein